MSGGPGTAAGGAARLKRTVDGFCSRRGGERGRLIHARSAPRPGDCRDALKRGRQLETPIEKQHGVAAATAAPWEF